VALYRGMDVKVIGATLARADRTWLVVSVAMILPITVLRAARFFWVAPSGSLPSVTEALRLTLVSSAVNVFVPAKGGDLVKSYFIAKRSRTSAGVSVAIVVYERLCDLFGLITWCVLGWLVGHPKATVLPAPFWILLAAVGSTCAVFTLSIRASQVVHAIVARVTPDRWPRRLRDLAEGWPDLMQQLAGRRHWIVLFSLLLWLTHLFQLWLFTRTLSASIPFAASASLSAIALMAGQLPFTLAGLGARDLALVVLMAPYMAPETAAALGILTATRNLLPPLLGAPLMGPYLSSAVDHAREWRTASERAE
jgi:uncharacterized protein (TIRG00374 family)